MDQLCFNIESVEINDTGNDKTNHFVVKFIDPDNVNQHIQLKWNNQDKEETKWLADINDKILQMMLNDFKIEIYEIVDGSKTENKIGTPIQIDLSSFLYGEIEINSVDDIIAINDDTKVVIGTFKWNANVTNNIFSDHEIDFSNFLNIEIGEMQNIPQMWVDQLLSSNSENNTNGKKKGKQTFAPKHWLECEWKLFDEDTIPTKIRISNNGIPNLMEHQTENDEEKKNTYCVNWDYKSKHLLTLSNMQHLINKFKNKDDTPIMSKLKIVHKYEEMNGNEEIDVKQDLNIGIAKIDIKTILQNNQKATKILITNDIKPETTLTDQSNNEEEQNENNDEDNNKNVNIFEESQTHISIEISLNKTLKDYCNELDNNTEFKNVVPFIDNNKESTNENEAGQTKTQNISVEESVNKIIEILIDEQTKFKSNTTIQNYDKQRMQNGFVYHLNKTGLYQYIKEKLVKPQMLQYKQALITNNDESSHPLSVIHQRVLNDMINNLTNKMNKSTLFNQNVNYDQKVIVLNIKKNTQIAMDMETQKLMDKAEIYYQKAFDQSELLSNTDIQWNALQNLTKILITNSKVDQAISLLISFLSNQPNYNECLMYLAIILIEYKHKYAQCVLYELNNQTQTTTSLILKCAYFGLNEDDRRSNINFKKAMKNAKNDTMQFQQPLNILFELKCSNIIEIILDKLQKRNQIDIYFHINTAKFNLETEHFDNAHDAINKALEIDDENAMLWAIKGHIAYKENKINEAIQYYIKHLQLIPGTTESLLPKPSNANPSNIIDKLVIYRLGTQYQNENKFKESIQTFFDGIEYDTESWLYWYEVANSFYKLNNYKECIHCMEQANIINNNEPHSWCILAICHLLLHQPQKAITLMKEALKFDENIITNSDKLIIKEFGDKLIDIGHIESGTYFSNYFI